MVNLVSGARHRLRQARYTRPGQIAGEALVSSHQSVAGLMTALAWNPGGS